MLWTVLLSGTTAFAPSKIVLLASATRVATPRLLAATPLQRVLQDLNSDDWQPLRPRVGAWAQPCFFSSFLTALSVSESLRRGLFVPFGVGPLLVLCSSLLYWHNPVKESPRRQLDLVTVRLGLAVQVLLTMRYCHLVALPRLLFGYLLGAACYTRWMDVRPVHRTPRPAA